MKTTLKTITVRELIEALEGQDPDALVIFTADYGDYHHTAQALPLRGEVDDVYGVTESAYSNSGFALVMEEDVDDPDDEPEVESPKYVVLR